MPPFCHARRQGAFVVLFPMFRPRERWPHTDPPQSALDFRRHLRNRYYGWEWRRRLASYRHLISNSAFTQTWTRQFWGAESVVIYPPVETAGMYTEQPRGRLIISVGRFSGGGHSKKHRELIEAFGALSDLRNDGWSYEFVGACGASDADRDYFEKILQVANSHGARLRPNVTRAELLSLYSCSTLFVHGAGFGEPEDHPERAEHFGIVTVEAMAAGCIPLVANRGGQPEIVRHGIDGLVWNSLEELQEQLRTVAENEALRQRLGKAASERASLFSKERFVHEMRSLLEL